MGTVHETKVWINVITSYSIHYTKLYDSGMTLSGSKVEGYEIEGEEISNVVVGKILEISPHENADALFVCQVDVAQASPIQIVTNAKNVKVNDLVPVALDGASLPDGKIVITSYSIHYTKLYDFFPLYFITLNL